MTTLPPSVSRMSENMGASTSRNPKGLHGLYRDNVTLPFTVRYNTTKLVLHAKVNGFFLTFNRVIIIFYYFIYLLKLQMGFNPVAVVLQ
jgi:hypothetical protein